MRVHIRFASTCDIFRVQGLIVCMPYFPSRKIHWPNSIWYTGPGIWFACKIWLASTFSQETFFTLRSNYRHALMNWLYISEHKLYTWACLSIKAFAHFSTKVQLVKHSNPPLPHIQIWKKPENATFASGLMAFPRLGSPFATHRRVEGALKSFEESSQSVMEKARCDPKVSKNKRPKAVQYYFLLSSSGAFQSSFTATTATRTFFSSSAISFQCFQWCTIFTQLHELPVLQSHFSQCIKASR